MALTRLFDFLAGTRIVSDDVDAEFNQIINSALTLISPLTGNLNVNNNQLTNLRVENVTATPSGSNAGRVVFHTAKAELQVMDGSFVRHIPTLATPSQGDLVAATDSGIWGRLARGSDSQFLTVRNSLLAWSTNSAGSLATQSAYILATTATWNPGVVAATQSATVSATITGAQAGDVALAALSSITGIQATQSQITAIPYQADTLIVKLHNTATAAQTYTSGTLRVVVVRF